MRNLSILVFSSMLLAANGAQAQNVHNPVKSIYWSDGDSGRITLPDGQVVKFRIDDWDAPETGGIGAAVGPAQCELERERGYAAKEFMVSNTRASVTFTDNNQRDNVPNRKALLVHLYVDGASLIEKAVSKGHLKSWKHDGSKALEPRPDWCGGN